MLVLKVARIELGNSVANSIKQENKLHLKENSFHRFSPKSLARAISGLLLGDNNVLRKKQSLTLKGKLGDFFYWLKVFIGPKLGQVSKGNFHQKAPK